MSARIEVQAPVRHPLRAYVWALAIALFLATALWIWNMGGGSSTATKTGTTTPVTKTVEQPQKGLVSTGGETHPRPYEGITVPASGGGDTAVPAESHVGGSAGTVASSPQQL
jgi:hypothetical protein